MRPKLEAVQSSTR